MNIIEAQKNYFPGDVALSLFNIVGSPGSGKSVFANFLVSRFKEVLGRSKINYIKTRDIRDSFKEIDPARPFQIFFIDDAGKKQASRDSMNNEEIYQDLPDIRHISQDVHGLDEGRVIILLCSHVPKHLDLVIRNFEKIRFYKDLSLTESQTRQIINNLYPKIPKNQLAQWVNRVQAEDPNALSKVLAVQKSGSWSWINFDPVEEVEADRNLINYQIPERGDSSSSENSKDTIDYSGEDLEDLISKVLGDMKKSNEYETKARVLDQSLNTAKSNLDIAQKLDVKEGSINYYKKQAMGELKRRVGLEYEKIVADELEDRGYKEISRMGGTGEPDIIALDPDGTEIAVSVKLYSYARPRHSLDKEEFNPELNYRDQNEAEAWIWYTNLEWGGTGGKTYFEEIPEALDRVVLHKKKGLVE